MTKTKTTTTAAKKAPATKAAPAPAPAAAPEKAKRTSLPNAERRTEYTHPDGRAAVEFGPCAKCGAVKAERCIRHDGERTNYVHGPRFKSWETRPMEPKRTRKAAAK